MDCWTTCTTSFSSEIQRQCKTCYFISKKTCITHVLQGNTTQEAMSKRSQASIPQSTAPRRDKAPKLQNQQRSKKCQSPPQIPEGDAGSYASLQDQVKNTPKNMHKHPLCAHIFIAKYWNQRRSLLCWANTTGMDIQTKICNSSTNTWITSMLTIPPSVNYSR